MTHSFLGLDFNAKGIVCQTQNRTYLTKFKQHNNVIFCQLFTLTIFCQEIRKKLPVCLQVYLPIGTQKSNYVWRGDFFGCENTFTVTITVIANHGN